MTRTALFAGIPLLSVGLLALTGCTSIRSTHVMHNPRECTWDKKHLHGIPITVKVPSQLEVRVVETKFLLDGRMLLTLDDVTKVPLATRRVETDVREKDEIFTVDFVRPAAGVSELEADIKNQYFTSIT